MKTKICRKCGETKPIDDFTQNVAYSDGRSPQCKVCRRKSVKKSTERRKNYVGLDEALD